MSEDQERYFFGDFLLDLACFELRHADGRRIHLEPRVLDLLAHLVRHRHRVVSKEELLDSVWATRFVSETALTSCLKTARRAVGDSGERQAMIRTVPRRGYQFIAPVERVEPVAPASVRQAGGSARLPRLPRPVPRQDIRYCHTEDGVCIAHATTGRGPLLVKAANWLTHLDLEWSSPVWAHWLEGLAAGRTLVRYDERGCGMSDWDVGDFTFDDWVDDLAAVVEANGLDRFPLLGVSQGGAVAVAYAVRHPERVSRLVLAGAYAQGRMVRARKESERRAAELDLELARVGWTQQDPSFLQVFASQFLPDGTPEEWREFIELQRRTTSTANAVRFLEVFGSIDVTEEAQRVVCPTLVLHARGDVRVPIGQAGLLAGLIPQSRLVLLDSRNHLLTGDEPAWADFLAELDEFLA